MKFKPKPIEEQVMVITGASSGIGLTTALMAARLGTRVVLAARNADDLERAVQRIRADGGRAIHVACDVSVQEQVDAVARRAVSEFGAIDTWVNNAAVAIYGKTVEVPVDDMRRLFDVNYWGEVYGTLAAVRHLRERGGVIINVASAVADRAIPLQGAYSATKQALKAFTDTLRMELEEDGIPIELVLLKPSSIDTPFFRKAKTLMGVEPQPIPPVYAPEVVARMVIRLAEKPRRDLIVGGMGKVMSLGEKLSSRATDRFMERSTFDAQKTQIEAPADRPSNLYEPVDSDGGERGRVEGKVRKWSAYTEAVLHPGAAAALLAGLGAGVAAATRALRRRGSR
jgi:short-subunit dehydrogenase